MIYNPSIFEAEYDTEFFLRSLEEHWPEYFGKYSRFYNIATESVKDYVPFLGSNIESALTIGASADQGIALTKNGAKDVYFFDINKAAYYFLMIKKYALLYLKRKDFMDFLIAENGQVIMNYKLYCKFSDKLPKQIKLFWDQIYDYFNYNHADIAYYIFRSPKEHSSRSRVINDYYVNSEVYYETRKNLYECNWHFIESDFYKLGENLPEGVSFDAIILSNIYEYLNFGEEVTVENAKKYVTFIKEVLLPKLKDNGSVMSAYLCKYDDEVHKFIELSLKADPNGWARCTNLIRQLDNIEKCLDGYTGQNVSYYYLLNEMEKELPIQKVMTKHSGYGMSSANEDMAIITKK